MLQEQFEKLGKSSAPAAAPKKENKSEISEIEKHYKAEVEELEKQIGEVEKKYQKLRDANSELVKSHKEAVAKLAQRQKEYEEMQRASQSRASEAPVEEKREMVGIKEGKQEFFYNQDSLGRQEVEYLQDRVSKLLFNKPVDFEEVVQLNGMLQKDAGRRVFTFVLKSTMKKVPSLVVSDNSFELIFYLMNAALKDMNLQDSVNFITASVLLKASKIISRKIKTSGKEELEYIVKFIKHHPVWNALEFWEEHFWGKKTAVANLFPVQLFLRKTRFQRISRKSSTLS